MTRATKEARLNAWRKIFHPPILTRSVIVAVLVGIALNLVNQGDVLLAGAQPLWWKVALTFCVPFCVASYGSYSALVSAAKDDDNGPA